MPTNLEVTLYVFMLATFLGLEVIRKISDLYPRRAVATIAGLGGAAGAVGGILMAQAAGRILDATGSYLPWFIYAGLAYFIAFGVIHLLVPKMEPARV